ncbi:prepilin-type N-terminal cleavage/methylation domain-containing protein [Oceanobacillus senegalensis]|uniref:prepilin-type N-terminal cleavage/methylation domain-containing protein n=1 Tax=Oceanobacillus senegalensis TaxID=1936063 RepID=UPI0015C4E275|nr:prepilin-type N-terminal cleavage/methylation domain-containing protein [Oceanobacillus senegalensis]
MLKSGNGFTLIEVIVATSIFFTLVSTFIPMITLLSKEQGILKDRRNISYHLHDELQPFLWENKPVPNHYTDEITGRTVTFSFTRERGFIKGCAAYENGRHTDETICFYGLPQR